MQVKNVEKVLETLNRQMVKEERNAILFLDNVTVHPTSLVDKFSNIKAVFLPKNTISQLQPLDAGTIKSFKFKVSKEVNAFMLLHVSKRIC